MAKCTDNLIDTCVLYKIKADFLGFNLVTKKHSYNIGNFGD